MRMYSSALDLFVATFKLLSVNNAASIYIALLLNLILYPTILSYQSGDKLAQFISQKKEIKEVYFINNHPSLSHYYAHFKIISLQENKFNPAIHSKKYIFCDQKFIEILNQDKIQFKILSQFVDFRTTVLTAQFINPDTRDSVLQHQFLILVN